MSAEMMNTVGGDDEHGRRRVLDDPLGYQLANLPSSTTSSASDVVDAALALADIFESRAASSSVFRNSLVASLESIVRNGVLGAIGNYELRAERPRSEVVEPT